MATYSRCTGKSGCNGRTPINPNAVPVEVPLHVEETKVTCATGMLLCLDRRQRLIFTLGEILGISDAVGGEVLEMTADNFRQSLARAATYTSS